MNDQDSPLDAFTGENDIVSSDSNGSVADSSESLTLTELNAMVGRNYKDKATALKSLKETYSTVTKAGQLEQKVEKLKAQLTDKDSALGEIKQIKEQLFYTQNPQYAPYKETISAMGSNPSEVVEKDAFKKIFVDLSEYEKTKSAKSVLVSNPRIGQAKTKLDEAKDLSNKGKYVDAASAATSAVLEAYDISA